MKLQTRCLITVTSSGMTRDDEGSQYVTVTNGKSVRHGPSNTVRRTI